MSDLGLTGDEKIAELGDMALAQLQTFMENFDATDPSTSDVNLLGQVIKLSQAVASEDANYEHLSIDELIERATKLLDGLTALADAASPSDTVEVEAT